MKRAKFFLSGTGIVLAVLAVVIGAKLGREIHLADSELGQDQPPPSVQEASRQAPLALPVAPANDPAPALPEESALLADSARDGAQTHFDFFSGEIGYVDVEALVRTGDPSSVVHLLQKHGAITGANELLELETEWAGREGAEGYSASFGQSIAGIPVRGYDSQVHMRFDSSGAVSSLDGSLVDPKEARADRIIVLSAEAEALAREAAFRFMDQHRARYVARGGRERMLLDAKAEGLYYALNPEAGNSLRAEWQVWIMVKSPISVLQGFLDAETGEVIKVENAMDYMAAPVPSSPVQPTLPCAKVDFRVCNGNTAPRKEEISCAPDEEGTNSIVYDEGECVGSDQDCGEAIYKRPSEESYEALAHVQGINGKYTAHIKSKAKGNGCVIDILSGNQELLGNPDALGGMRTAQRQLS